MSMETKLVKLVSGETVMGSFDEGSNTLKDVVLIQTIPTATGSVQVALLPFGFPYDETIEGSAIDGKHIIYTYVKVPEELKKKYIEAKSNIRIASSLDGLEGGGNGGGKILL